MKHPPAVIPHQYTWLVGGPAPNPTTNKTTKPFPSLAKPSFSSNTRAVLLVYENMWFQWILVSTKTTTLWFSNLSDSCPNSFSSYTTTLLLVFYYAVSPDQLIWVHSEPIWVHIGFTLRSYGFIWAHIWPIRATDNWLGIQSFGKNRGSGEEMASVSPKHLHSDRYPCPYSCAAETK